MHYNLKNPYRPAFTWVSHKIIDRHLNFFAFFQPLQCSCHKLKIKGIWMVKVVFIPSSKLMLFLTKYLWQEKLLIAWIHAQ